MAYLNEQIRTAYIYLLISILLPSLHFALALLVLDKASPSIILTVLALSCALPLSGYTSIWSRLATTQRARHSVAQPHIYDLFWVVPAGIYASISTIQRYFIVALYALSMSHDYNVPRGVFGVVYALGIVEWVLVSWVTIKLWRASRESDYEDVEKTYGVQFDVPTIVVTVLE